jgi:Na+/H+ antiporter NhaD/arsenite permease-like protein
MAMVGAVLMFVFRILTPKNAIESVDFGTLVLLFARMLIVASLHVAGFFEGGAIESSCTSLHGNCCRESSSPAESVGISGERCCLFVRGAPRSWSVQEDGAAAAALSVVLATASDIGGAETITGSPQNMLIGSVSGISYRDFAAHLGPVAVIGLFLDWALIDSIYIFIGSCW